MVSQYLYSNGLTPSYFKNLNTTGPFDIQTIFDHMNTRNIRYSDPHKLEPNEKLLQLILLMEPENPVSVFLAMRISKFWSNPPKTFVDLPVAEIGNLKLEGQINRQSSKKIIYQ